MLITTNMHARAGGYVIGAGVHLYVYMYVCDPKKRLNGTLMVDSPF